MTRLKLARLAANLLPVGFLSLLLLQYAQWQTGTWAEGRESELCGRACVVLHHGDPVTALAFSPDGRSLATAGGTLLDQGDLKIWDLHHGKVRVGFRSLHRWTTALSFFGDDHTLVSVNQRTAHRRRAAAPDQVEPLFQLTWLPAKAAFAADGRTAAYSDREGRLLLVDVPSGDERMLWDVPDYSWYSVSFSADGRSLAAAGRGRVQVWDVATGEVCFSASRPDDSLSYAVALSSDGGTLAHVSGASTFRLVDVPSGRERVVCGGHDGWVVCLAFAADGRLASGGRDGGVVLWDADGRQQARLEGHADPVNCLTFSPDGRRLASGGEDGTARVWRLDALAN